MRDSITSLKKSTKIDDSNINQLTNSENELENCVETT